MAVTCCDYFDIVPQESHIGPLAMFFSFLGTIGHRQKNKVGRLLKDDREICSSHGFCPHDFCVHGLSDEPNCRVNSLGNSCDGGYSWWNLVEFISIPTKKYIYIYLLYTYIIYIYYIYIYININQYFISFYMPIYRILPILPDYQRLRPVDADQAPREAPALCRATGALGRVRAPQRLSP